jgi:hypothetical protein
MQDFVTLGTAPVDEPFAQVGQPGYDDTVKDECRRFIRLLRQKFGDEPPGVRFAIKSFEHDFGTYYEVVVLFDTDDEETSHYAYRCEAELPATWEDAHAVYTLPSEVGHLDCGPRNRGATLA